MARLAKGHIMNWFGTDRSIKARTSFEFARTSLQMTSIAPGLTEGAILEDENAEADILAVANVFPEIEKTSQVWKAIGLEITISDSERYHVLCFIGEVELDLSETVDGKEERDEHVRKAYSSINAGLALYQEKEEVKTFAEREEWKSVLQSDISNRGRCEIKLGQLDKVIATMDEAYKVMNDSLDDKFVNDITAELENREDFEKRIRVVKQFKNWDLLSWLGFGSAEANDRFQRAAWECKKEDFLIKTYRTIITEVDKYNLGAHVRSQLATAYQLVFPNYKEAKRFLFEILDGKKQVAFGDADEDFIFAARLQIADILVEQFRATVDLKEKISFCTEMRNLALQHGLAMSNDFNPYESQSAISLALMMGKLGPMHEFQDLMEKAFRGCVDSLSDTQAWNDSPGFRLLAKVLAFIPELKREAQIAYSLQFSSVDESIFNPPEDVVEENAAKAEGGKEMVMSAEAVVSAGEGRQIPTAQAMAITPETAKSNLEISNQTVALPSNINDSLAPSEETKETPRTEDLNPYSKIWCNGCPKTFSDWNDGSVYLCIICTNCDLCEDCWKKRDECNKGKEWMDWKRFCGEGHRYIKGPVRGWKGVKGGVIKIEGVGEGGDKGGNAEEIVFKEWLEGLQGRWAEAWRGFWKREELVVDIF